MFDPKCLLKWPFWLLHAPLVSAANSKKVSVWWKTPLSFSLQDSCCKRLKNSKFMANLIHAMDLPRSAKLSWVYLKKYLARKSETQNTCKQTVKYVPLQHERFTYRTIKLISVKDNDGRYSLRSNNGVLSNMQSLSSLGDWSFYLAVPKIME